MLDLLLHTVILLFLYIKKSKELLFLYIRRNKKFLIRVLLLFGLFYFYIWLTEELDDEITDTVFNMSYYPNGWFSIIVKIAKEISLFFDINPPSNEILLFSIALLSVVIHEILAKYTYGGDNFGALVRTTRLLAPLMFIIFISLYKVLIKNFFFKDEKNSLILSSTEIEIGKIVLNENDLNNDVDISSVLKEETSKIMDETLLQQQNIVGNLTPTETIFVVGLITIGCFIGGILIWNYYFIPIDKVNGDINNELMKEENQMNITNSNEEVIKMQAYPETFLEVETEVSSTEVASETKETFFKVMTEVASETKEIFLEVMTEEVLEAKEIFLEIASETKEIFKGGDLGITKTEEIFKGGDLGIIETEEKVVDKSINFVSDKLEKWISNQR